jgi:hypothetical protein
MTVGCPRRVRPRRDGAAGRPAIAREDPRAASVAACLKKKGGQENGRASVAPERQTKVSRGHLKVGIIPDFEDAEIFCSAEIFGQRVRGWARIRLYSLTRRSQQVMRLLCGYAAATYLYATFMQLVVDEGAL